MKSLFRTITFVFALILSFNVNGQETATRDTIQETGGNIVVHLETANWGQGHPFNAQCWTSYGGTTHALAGCVPVAYAIVMRYHGFPTEGTSKKLYNGQAPTYVEITDRTYDFEKMPLTYDGNWSEEQINEVAKLMSHLGHAFMVSYGAGGTSVSDPQNTDKVNKYFNYNLVYASYQRDYTQEQWENKIIESLDNGCPVIYASDNAGTGDTRHMFVVDGYTDNGYFHFNFGWNGSGNGWFKLNKITPYQGDDYSWQNGADHYAIFNLQPNATKQTVTATVSHEDYGTVTINGGTAGSEVVAELFEGSSVTLTATANSGYSFVNWTKGDIVISTESTIKVDVETNNNDYVANFAESTFSPTVEYSIEISPNTGILNNGNAKSSVWTFTTTEESPVELTITTTSENIAVNAMSVSSNKFKYYANAWDDNEKGYSNIKYTLSVPQGYIITEYNMTYWVSSTHKGEVTISNTDGSYTPTNTDDQYLAATPNAQTTEFTLSVVSTAKQQYITIEKFTVTIQKEGNSATDIKIVETAENAGTDEIYNIRGQKLDKINGPGIYIVNGKKILKK